MKVFVAIDMEGVAGLVQWSGPENDLEQRLMTEEVNAAARGAFAAGALEVRAGQSHWTMRNLLPESLDPRVKFVSGQPKRLNHMAGIDPSFTVAMLIGYHSKAGTLRGLMSHTFSQNIFSLTINGQELGEIGVDAALCGALGVPVGLVTGDQAACDEALALLGNSIYTVAVKQALSRSAALCTPVAQARQMIEQAATVAVQHVGQFTPFVILGPVTVQIVFTDPSLADTVEPLDWVTRLDGRTVRFGAPDFISAFERFNALNFLAPVIR
jgi:D-amino peptidase